MTTPEPTQLIIVNNCNKFHFVKSGEGCAYITSKYSITGAEFLKWNPSIETGCTGLWANAWACVSTIDHKPSTPTKPTTTAKPSATGNVPSPVQGGIIKNCNTYHLVSKITTCSSIEKYYSLPSTTFYKWNSSVRDKC